MLLLGAVVQDPSSREKKGQIEKLLMASRVPSFSDFLWSYDKYCQMELKLHLLYANSLVGALTFLSVDTYEYTHIWC